MAASHKDFGEKIGGAKKDLWRERGLYADDLSGMNDREAEKYVKKDKGAPPKETPKKAHEPER